MLFYCLCKACSFAGNSHGQATNSGAFRYCLTGRWVYEHRLSGALWCNFSKVQSVNRAVLFADQQKAAATQT